MDLWPDFPLPSPEAALRDSQSSSDNARAAAAKGLGCVKKTDPVFKQAVSRLRDMLGDECAGVRGNAALSLGNLKADEALKDIAALVSDPDHGVVQDAVSALGLLANPNGAEAVHKAFESTDPDIRFQAVTAVTAVDPENAPALLIKSLDDNDAEVRACAAAALGDINAREAANHLALLLDDEDRHVALEAAVSLARMGDDRGGERLVAALNDRLNAPDAALYLGSLKYTKALDELRGIYSHWWHNRAARINSAAAAAAMGDRNAVEFLQKRLGRKGLEGALARSAAERMNIKALVGEVFP